MRERLMLGYNHQLTFKVMQLHVWYATLSGMYVAEVTTMTVSGVDRLCNVYFVWCLDDTYCGIECIFQNTL